MLLKTEHGHRAGVLNVALKSAAAAFPAPSLTPAEPPATVIVYERPSASGADGVSVAVRVAASYATVEVTEAFRSFLSVIVVALTVEAVIASLNVTVGCVEAACSDAPSAGVTELTLGPFVSGGALALNTASTQ